jgi:4'-phosphopantetheinyl transferase
MLTTHRRHRLLGRRVETWSAIVPRGWKPPDDNTIPFADERRVSAAGRLLARRVLGRKLGLPPHRVPITVDADGRPCLSTPSYDFNLSHSGDRVVLAVAAGLRVGVDVERLDERAGRIEVARKVFAAREHESLVHADRRHYLRRWYRIWTTREAYCKALGIGALRVASALDERGPRWARATVPVTGDYMCSVVAVADHPRRR